MTLECSRINAGRYTHINMGAIQDQCKFRRFEIVACGMSLRNAAFPTAKFSQARDSIAFDVSIDRTLDFAEGLSCCWSVALLDSLVNGSCTADVGP